MSLYPLNLSSERIAAHAANTTHTYRDINYHFVTTLGPLGGVEAELIELSW